MFCYALILGEGGVWIRCNTSSVETQLFVFFGRKAIISIFADAYQKAHVLNQKAFMCFGAEECEALLLSWTSFLSPPASERGYKTTLIAALYPLCSGTDACWVDETLDLEMSLSGPRAAPTPEQGSPHTQT